jgi:hypothetical protein
VQRTAALPDHIDQELLQLDLSGCAERAGT